jgi:sulfide:quinone oxidoreductase
VKDVVILGAGFAGLELATQLSESLAGEVGVTLIDQNDSFSFGFSKLDILFGRKATADVLLPYADISREGIEFRQEQVTSIEPEQRRVLAGAAWMGEPALVLGPAGECDRQVPALVHRERSLADASAGRAGRSRRSPSAEPRTADRL